MLLILMILYCCTSDKCSTSPEISTELGGHGNAHISYRGVHCDLEGGGEDGSDGFDQKQSRFESWSNRFKRTVVKLH